MGGEVEERKVRECGSRGVDYEESACFNCNDDFMTENVIGLPAPLAMAKMGSELLNCYVLILVLKKKLEEVDNYENLR